jgi:alpha-glucosidase
VTASIARPPRFELAGRDGPRLTLRSDQGFGVDIFVLEADIIRMLHTPPGGLAGARTWAIAPGAEDAPPLGRDRLDSGGFSHPPYTVETIQRRLIVATERLRLTVGLDGLFCAWEMLGADGWRLIASDRPTQAITSAGGRAARAIICGAIRRSGISGWGRNPARSTGPGGGSG